MRGGKNQNLSYSSNDVAWSMLDKNLLATAATNGVVSVWDLSKFGRHKQLLVYAEHERTAHSVTFHTTDPNLLLSGSQDGTIKCFDMRTEKSVTTYFSNSESVRDVKFSPVVPNLFASVSENGTVQLWDLKRTGIIIVVILWLMRQFIFLFCFVNLFHSFQIDVNNNLPHTVVQFIHAIGIPHSIGWQRVAEINRLKYGIWSNGHRLSIQFIRLLWWAVLNGVQSVHIR